MTENECPNKTFLFSPAVSHLLPFNCKDLIVLKNLHKLLFFNENNLKCLPVFCSSSNRLPMHWKADTDNDRLTQDHDRNARSFGGLNQDSKCEYSAGYISNI
jgi:hypothetical protein